VPSVQGLLREGWLVWSLAQRTLETRYRGSTFGALWTLLYPLALLLIYGIVFSGVLNVRFAGGTTADFALFVFCGLVPFTMLSESLSGATSAIVANANLVKKTAVRSHVFPLGLTVAALVGQLPALLLVVLGAALLHRLSWTALLLPLLLLPQLLLSAGLNVLAAALGVYLRDLAQLVGLALTGWFLLTPIFYPESAVPERLRWLLAVNPLAWLVSGYRSVLLLGELPPPSPLLAAYLVGAGLLALSLWIFGRLRPGFPDVL